MRHFLAVAAARLLPLGALLRAVLGAPDYERYLAHHAAHHPGRPALSPEEFARACMAARYDRPGSRCC